MSKVLITGGAGFIGRHLVDRLLSGHHEVLVYDLIIPQVHGFGFNICDFACHVVVGDITDIEKLSQTVRAFKPDKTIHLASETGTGQSRTDFRRYCSVNIDGTSNIITALNESELHNHKLILSSSRAVYGEGACADKFGVSRLPVRRKRSDMEAGIYSVFDLDRTSLVSVPTPETHSPRPDSIYASTKLMQELLLLQSLTLFDFHILRFQNVYGPGQSMRNPYTGVLSIFANRIINDLPISIYEDGNICRDFVYVTDVVEAICSVAFGNPSHQIYNVGSGISTSINDAVAELKRSFANHGFLATSTVTGEFRDGDIRCASADIGLIRKDLDWEPVVSLRDGLNSFVQSLLRPSD